MSELHPSSFILHPSTWLPLSTAAAIARVTTGTIRRATAAGELRHRRLPGPGDKIEIEARDLQRWAAQQTCRKDSVLDRLDAERRNARESMDLAVQCHWKKKRRRATPAMGDVAQREFEHPTDFQESEAP